MITILSEIAARLIEAYRNAEQFVFPELPRSVLWHLLKFPQFGLWLLAGYKAKKWHYPVLGIIIAWPVFELSLRYFRSVM
jgi:hypothetical protein